jgi:mycobactin phenyloxazoline synthetase
MPQTMQLPPTADDIKRAIADLLEIGPEEIGDDQTLSMLGVSSLEVMRLVTRWRRAGLTVDFEWLMSEPTVGAWEAHLREVWAGAGSVRPAKGQE